MGIRTTVQATRAASLDDLVGLSIKRLDRMLLTGTTTAEAKSGYGLNLEDEVKQLEALRDAAALHPVDIVPTFMGAHDIPPEYRDRREGYVRLLIDALIPEVRQRGLAEFFDIFCEPSAFSLEETRTLVAAAKAAGFKVKIHADEFVSQGGTELAAEVGAVSAEHLIAISDEGISRLAASETAAILLPGVSYFLMMDKHAPARRLIDAGAAVALASDFNPGSSHISSIPFILQLGVFTLGMTVEEALNACTGNAAYAIGRHGTVGSLEPGKKMDLLLCDVPDHVSLAYEAGRNPVRTVIKNGQVVVEDGRRVAPR
jgi:imidazolonepropionase